MKPGDTIQIHKNKEGAALLVVIGIISILILIVGSFAFESKLEAMLVSHKNKRFHAENLARSGVEYAKAILDQHKQAKELEIEDMAEEDQGFMMAALYVQRGLPATSEIELGNGFFSVTIESAEGKLNINNLNRDDWLDTFSMANVPSTEWDSMIDCLEDWKDANDVHGLNGAESDDPYYEELGYPVKNGPLDSVEELLLIKNWGPDILYGKPEDEESDAIFGIAELLTVWGDGLLNLNTASIDAMRAAGLTEEQIEEIIEARAGPDGIPGTADDGLNNLSGLDQANFKLQSNYVKVTSIGESFGSKYQIESIFLLKNKDSVVVYWNEGPVK